MMSKSEERYRKYSDADLVRMALKDKESFYFLMKRYESRLMRYIRHATNVSPQEAEDLLQEIFIKVYRNLNGFDARLSFSGWIYRIAHNEVVNYYHKNKRRLNHEEIAADDGEAEVLAELISDEPDGFEKMAKEEETRKIKLVLEKLPQKYRDVLILYYLEGLSYSEISDALRKPAGTVATLLNRAKTKFKTLAAKIQLEVLI